MASKMGIYGCLAVVALLLHVAPAASIPFEVPKIPVPKIPSTGIPSRTWAAGLPEVGTSISSTVKANSDSIFRVNWITPLTDVNKPAGKNFKVGDTLEFLGEASDVVEVPEKVYDTCDTISSALKAKAESTPVNITIYTNGLLYYRCTDPERCKGGQKLAINVGNSASPSGSSSSLTVSGFFITLASYILAFLY